MAIYHCSIKIISRAGGRSAVASAAYRSGEKLYNDETGITHDFTRKGGVVMNEIILPANAPAKYKDREILWNEVQKIEKRSDAQFAREVEVAFPVEMTRSEQIECVRDYINENFVLKGMIADFAIHDKGDGNPHAHIMLTIREIDENNKWMNKQKTVFANARDDKGRAIYNPDLPAYNPKDKESTSKYRIPALDKDGKQKVRIIEGKGKEYLWEKISIPLNDWNDHAKAEEWRASWAEHCNKYLDNEHKIDHRSYKRQGIDYQPTIHEGVTARKIEKSGGVSERCEINRGIREQNKLIDEIKKLAKEITDMIVEIARDVYGRFNRINNNRKNIGEAERDDFSDGRTAGRNRYSEKRKQSSNRGQGRINAIKRAVDEFNEEEELTDRAIARTDRKIKSTDRRIDRLKEIIKQKEADRDERIRKLKERRSASRFDGGDTGGESGITRGEPEFETGNLEDWKSEFKSFLGKLTSQERDSEEKRDDSISKRENRESTGSRSDTEREPEIKRRNRGRSR